MRVAAARSVRPSSSGVISMGRRVDEWSATACPSSNARLTMGAVSSFRCSSMTKNVACSPSAARTSSRSGVVDGLGPSSNVRYTVGLSVRGMAHTARSPAIQSMTNGAGHMWARAVTATPTIRNHIGCTLTQRDTELPIDVALSARCEKKKESGSFFFSATRKRIPIPFSASVPLRRDSKLWCRRVQHHLINVRSSLYSATQNAVSPATTR